MFEKVLHNLHKWFNYVKVIYVVRNPFDNIATLAMYDYILRDLKVSPKGVEHQKLIKKHKGVNTCLNQTDILLDTGKNLPRVVSRYITIVEQAQKFIKKFNPDLKVVFIREFVRKPYKKMLEICEFLELNCSHEFLSKVERKTFPKESKSRYSIKWNREQFKRVDKLVDLYPEMFQNHSFID